MKRPHGSTRLTNQPGYLFAVVLGTALSTLGATASAEIPDSTVQAVSAINRYCTACWRNAHLHPDTWPDCTQEVLCRLMERVNPDSWNRVLKDDAEERREFIRAIDTVKKRTQRTRKWSALPFETVADPRDRHNRQLTDDREVVRHAARQLLSPRQRDILNLSLEGWSVHDIASDLHISPERVSDEKYKAVQKLRAHLAGQA
jgi:RNA polymerase sigma factor (sigma-70 family)